VVGGRVSGLTCSHPPVKVIRPVRAALDEIHTLINTFVRKLWKISGKTSEQLFMFTSIGATLQQKMVVT